jgi:hypothetical protein
MIPRAETITAPWWFSPRRLVAFVLIPAYLLTWASVEVFELTLTTAKGYYFFRGEAFLIGLSGLVALLYGTLLPVNVFALRAPRYRDMEVPDWFVYGVGIAAVIGYVYWFKDILSSPAYLWSLLKSGGAVSYELRRNLERTAGLASFASLSLAFTVLLCHRVWVVGRPVLPLPLKLITLAIVGFTVFRVFAWAERLALIEIGTVFVLFWLVYAPSARRAWVKTLRGVFPILAVGAVIVLFAAGEYFRAWVSVSHREASFWGYILQRLLNYYAQALNTGAGMLTVLEWPTYRFEQTLDWLHKFPILLGPIFRYLMQPEQTFYLERFADPEFNNLSGVFILFYDMGIPLALLACAVLGVVCQSSYLSFLDRGNVFGLVFPLMFFTLIEFLRIWYLGNSRAFLLILATACAILVARRRTSPEPDASPYARRGSVLSTEGVR